MKISTDNLITIAKVVEWITDYTSVFYVLWIMSNNKNIPVLLVKIKGYDVMRIEGLFAIFHTIDKLRDIDNKKNTKRDQFIEELYSRLINKDENPISLDTEDNMPTTRIINRIRKLFPDIALKTEIEN